VNLLRGYLEQQHVVQSAAASADADAMQRTGDVLILLLCSWWHMVAAML